MNREEFMRQLEQLLEDITETERREALDYYEGYFEDAGPENEAKVIQELGSPGKVAAIIKADLQENGSDYGEYTERGYEDERVREETQVPGSYGKTNRAKRGYHSGGRKNRSTLILLIILAVFASPILLGVGGGILGILVGIAAGVVGIVAGMFGLVAGTVFGGLGILIAGIVECFKAPALGFVGIGLGLFGMALGMLVLVAFVWLMRLLIFRFFPWAVRKISDLVQNLTHRVRERKEQGGVNG